MALTAASFRADKRCGKSGIPDNAKCSKQTAAKSAGLSTGEGLKETAFKVATVVQGARAARSYVTGNKGRAVKQLLSAGKNAAEYAQERGERTGNKKLLAFATGKNVVESVQAFKRGNFAKTANTALEAYTFNRQRQGKAISSLEQLNRGFGDLLQVQEWAGAVDKNYNINSSNAIPKAKAAWRNKPTAFKPKRPNVTGRSTYRGYKRSLLDGMELTAANFRDDACWKGYVQKGVKRKGNRTVPNCVPAGKAKAEVKRKTGQDGEDKLTSAKRTVWAEGFEPKKTKARR